MEKLIGSEKNIYLYLERNDEELYNGTINKLVEENGTPFVAERELVYLNPVTNEIIYQLSLSKNTETEATEESPLE